MSILTRYGLQKNNFFKIDEGLFNKVWIFQTGNFSW